MNLKKLILIVACVSLSGCNTVYVLPDSSFDGLSVDPLAIDIPELQSIKDDVLIAFDENACPTWAQAVVPNCSPPLGGAMCRRGGNQIKFRAVEGNPAFGIEFENQAVFNPCNGNLGVGPGTKVCNIKNDNQWPEGETDLIIKYSVVTNGGAECRLDPYLVLRR